MNIQNQQSAYFSEILPQTGHAPVPAGQMSLSESLHKFANWIEDSVQLTPSSRRVYRSRLRHFRSFLDKVNWDVDYGSLQEASDAFIAGLRDSGAKLCTINNFISTFRMMSTVSGATSHLKFVYGHNPARIHLTEEEESRYLVAACERGQRDAVLALLFLTTGVRLGESVNICLNDLIMNPAGRIVAIRVRGRRCRLEVVSLELSSAIVLWLGARVALINNGGSNEYLFPNKTGLALHTTTLDNNLRTIGWRANLVVSARVLRATHIRNRMNKRRPND